MGGALLASLGGSPEPLVVSICTHRPEWVFFLASQASTVKLVDVMLQTKEKGCSFQQEMELVDDPADLVHCYERAVALVNRALAKGFRGDDIIVDYTGGTKTMTAAMALAALGKGVSFAYVSGSKRTKDGLGVVEDGFEEVRHAVSPWQLFAVEEQKRLQMLFNTYQFEGAQRIAEYLEPRVGYTEAVFYRVAALAAKGYGAWDLFNHVAAERRLAELSAQLERLPNLQSPRKEQVQGFKQRVKEHHDLVAKIVEESGKGAKPSRLLVLDLLANANRRAKQGKVDDAVARLYRALEMLAQAVFWEEFHIETASVPEDFVPESLKEEFHKYRRSDGKGYKIPLTAAYTLLRETGHTLGVRFAARSDELLKVLGARNSSILAHGTRPLRPETYETFQRIILEFVGVQNKDLVSFPELTIW